MVVKKSKRRRLRLLGFGLGSLALVIAILIFYVTRHPAATRSGTTTVITQIRPANPSIFTSKYASDPDTEVSLINAVFNIRQQYQSAGSDADQAAIQLARARALCTALHSRLHVRYWIGTIKSFSLTPDNLGALKIEIADNVYLSTNNNFISKSSDSVPIDVQSPNFTGIEGMQPGTEVMFSGSFFPDPTDCIQEVSLTFAGMISSPEFIFRFEAITRR
jgi:hypothetical protein